MEASSPLGWGSKQPADPEVGGGGRDRHQSLHKLRCLWKRGCSSDDELEGSSSILSSTPMTWNGAKASTGTPPHRVAGGGLLLRGGCCALPTPQSHMQLARRPSELCGQELPRSGDGAWGGGFKTPVPLLLGSAAVGLPWLATPKATASGCDAENVNLFLSLAAEERGDKVQPAGMVEELFQRDKGQRRTALICRSALPIWRGGGALPGSRCCFGHTRG